MPNASEESNLCEILKDIRKHPYTMRDLIEKLEDKSLFKKYISDDSKYKSFYMAYTIKLIQKYIPDVDEQEILLAAYGLLEDYQDIRNLNSRRMRYSERADNVNQLINSDWANPDDSLSKLEDGIIMRLENCLIKETTNNAEGKGWLNFASSVADDLMKRFPQGIPAQLPLPYPRYKELEETSSLGTDQKSVFALKKKLLISIRKEIIGILVVLGIILCIITNTIAKNGGKVEIQTSKISFRLDFSPNDYNRRSTSWDNDTLGDDGILNSQD